MQKRTIAEIVGAGVCVVGIGTATVLSGGNTEEMTLSQPVAAVESGSATGYRSESASPSEKPVTVQAASGQNIGIEVSFTAVPDSKKSSGKELVFVSDNPYVIVCVPVSGSFDLSEELHVSGVIVEIDGSEITLGKAEVSEKAAVQKPPADDSVKPQQTTTQNTTATTAKAEIEVPAETGNSYTVYVSATGKIHRKPDCSGMKTYTEMDYNTAISSGHVRCKRCYN